MSCITFAVGRIMQRLLNQPAWHSLNVEHATEDQCRGFMSEIQRAVEFQGQKEV